MTKQKFFAILVHCYTASGFLWALLTLWMIVREDYYSACLWMLVAIIVDSTDGFFARRYRVKEVLPSIEGRVLDDLSDFLNYTFLPAFMMIHAGWVPEPRLAWGIIPIIVSAFAFSNRGIKNEDAGYFLGFPSYWNVFAMYVLVWFVRAEIQWPTVVFILIFSVASLMPLRFVYPSRAIQWKAFFIWGGVLWVAGMFVILWVGEQGPMWWVYISALYPVAYLASPILFLARKR
jgi:phosphatidylcholine synthase